MRSSESLANLAPALVAAQRDMGAAKKTANNPHLKQMYADLSDVRLATMPALLAQNIGCTQGVSGAEKTVTVTTRLLHISGEWMEDSLTLPYVSNKGINEAQAAGSAISYARRYGLASMCCIPTEDDDGSAVGGAAPPATVTDNQLSVLRDMMATTNTEEAAFCAFLKVAVLEDLHAANYGYAMAGLNAKAKKLAESES